MKNRTTFWDLGHVLLSFLLFEQLCQSCLCTDQLFLVSLCVLSERGEPHNSQICGSLLQELIPK